MTIQIEFEWSLEWAKRAIETWGSNIFIEVCTFVDGALKMLESQIYADILGISSILLLIWLLIWPFHWRDLPCVVVVPFALASMCWISLRQFNIFRHGNLLLGCHGFGYFSLKVWDEVSESETRIWWGELTPISVFFSRTMGYFESLLAKCAPSILIHEKEWHASSE